MFKHREQMLLLVEIQSKSEQPSWTTGSADLCRIWNLHERSSG